MNRPEIGKMNRRIKIFHTMSVPDERLGFSKASVREDVVWGRLEPCKSSKDHSKPRNEVDTSLKSPV